MSDTRPLAITIVLFSVLCFSGMMYQYFAEYRQEPAEIAAVHGPNVQDKCAMHAKITGYSTKYVDGIGCYEKRNFSWELVEFPEE